LTPVLYTALELSNKTWRLALSNGAKGRHVIPDGGMLSCLNGVSSLRVGRRMHRARKHAAGDVSGLEPVLQQDARRVMDSLGGTAGDEDLAVTRQFPEP
jgi:hypothetical protein